MTTRSTIAILAVLLACIVEPTCAQMQVTVRDTEDKTYSANTEIRHHNVTVFIFVATDCPNSNSYAPELARLHTAYAAKGVVFYNVYSDPGEKVVDVRKHQANYRIPFPALMDSQQSLARAVGAKGTPESIVVSNDGKVLYRGRIDDRFASYGRTRINVDQHDLRDVLDEVLAGKPVSHPYEPSLGCAIPGVMQ
jgi:thiol-disulfide isomerase/thioredoxin